MRVMTTNATTNGATSLATALLAAALVLPVPAAAQAKCYVDRGVKVCFPKGDISFADRLVSFTPGTPRAVKRFSDPAQALGPPNYDRALEKRTDIQQKFVSMGCGGTLVLVKRETR